MSFLIFIAGIAVVALVSYFAGYEKGYHDGEQAGRLDQHYYQKGIELKARRR